MSKEVEVTVYEFDGAFIAVCPDFPGVTGHGASQEAALEDLQSEIEMYQNRRLISAAS